jgi:hypothetical protein
MKRLIAATGLFVLALGLTTGRASADIAYQFSGVTFDDGATLTGTFTTNDAITALIAFDILTSAGSFRGFHFTAATADDSSTSLPFILVLNDPPTLDHILQVTFDGGLTATGAPIAIGPFDSFEQGPGAAGSVHRNITAGEVILATTELPEPTTAALVGLGLLGLFCIRRRRPT